MRLSRRTDKEEDVPEELSIDPVADERFDRVTGRRGVSFWHIASAAATQYFVRY